MESHKKFIEEFDYGYGFRPQSSSSRGSQNFHNQDLLMADSKHRIPASDIYPFEPPTNGYSSNFNMVLPKFFVEDRTDGWYEKLQPWGFVDHSHNAWGEPTRQERSHALDFQYMEPMNFLVPDATSCASGSKRRYGKDRVNKKPMQMKRKVRIRQNTHVVKGQWTVEEDR